MKRILFVSILLTLFAGFFSPNAQAQSVSITLDYDGTTILGCCTVCGDDYICFGGSCGCCIGTGTMTFTDPVPAGNTIVGVSITYNGVDCGATTIPSTINGAPAGAAPVVTTDCSCGGCYVHTGTATFPCTGIPGYNYGGMNTLQPNPDDLVCIDDVIITFDYVPTASFALPPIGAVTGPLTGCSGGTGSYTVPLVVGATTYTWTVPAGTVITSGQGTQTINVTYGATSGNICVTASSACDTEGPTCLAVTLSAIPTVTDPADQSVCEGSNTTAVNFTGTGGPTFNWTNSNTATGLAASGSGNIASFVGTNTTALPIVSTITVTPTSGCAGTPQTFTITVNPMPTIGAGADQAICTASPATLTASNPDGAAISWDNAVTNGTPFTPAGTLTYTVTATLFGCVATDQVQVSVNPLPPFTLAYTDPTACGANDGTITIGGLTATTNYNVSYTDGVPVGPAVIMSDGAGAIVLTGLNAGSYSNFIVDLAGCSATNPTVLVLIEPTPPIVGAGLDQTICIGGNVTLTANNPNSAVITWDNGVTNGVSFAPVATLTYTVTANLAGCISTDQAVVTVNPLPTIGAGLDQTVCAGTLVTLTANNPGGATLSWNNGVTNAVGFTPVATLTYTVTGTLLGCVNTDQVVVNVNPLPIVTASANPGLNLCIGDMVTLSGAGAVSYTWTSGITNGVAFAAIGTNTYTVTGTDGNGCQDTDNITLTVVNCALPIAAIGTGGSPTTICVNACVNFQDLSTGTNIDTWLWNLGAGGITSTAQNPATMCYGIAGTYTISLTVTDDVGSDSETFTLTVIDCIPPTAIFTMSDSVICLGECITLTDQSLENPTAWAWAFDNSLNPNTSTLQNPTICPTIPGTYDIELTVTNPFGVDVVSHSLVVNPIPLVSAGYDTTIEMNTDAQLEGWVDILGGTYSWIDDENIVCPSCDTTFVSPVFTETFTLIYITVEGCSASDSVLVTVLFEDLIDVPNGFSPNGDNNNEILFVKGDGIIDLQFTIYNRYGQKVFESFDQSIGWDGYLNGSPENPGVFVWYIDYKLVDGSSNTKKGNVTLIK